MRVATAPRAAPCAVSCAAPRTVSRTVSCTVSCSAKSPSPGASAGLDRLRRKLEARVAKLTARRADMEDARRRQLWNIAVAIDEIARAELDGRAAGPSSDADIEVAFAPGAPGAGDLGAWSDSDGL